MVTYLRICHFIAPLNAYNCKILSHFLPLPEGLRAAFAGPSVGDRGLRNRGAASGSEDDMGDMDESLGAHAAGWENNSARRMPMIM